MRGSRRDGLDELTLNGLSDVAEVREGAVRNFSLQASEVGLAPATLETLAGGDAQQNARIVESILQGESGPRRDIVLLNAAAALVVAGRAPDFARGVRSAADAIDSGAGQGLLANLRKFARAAAAEILNPKSLKKGLPMPLRLPCIAAALMFAATALPSHAQQIVVSKENRTIAVTTSADDTANADTVTVQIGFLAYGAAQDSAYAEGSKTSNAIAAALKAAGVPAEAIQSESQSIAPVQQYGNNEWTAAEKAERKFQVQQSWTVKPLPQMGPRCWMSR